MSGTTRVLIWAKTYPELSNQYKETVCTGGSTADGRPIRLYPVPLRYLPEAESYKLYDWIEAPLAQSTQDRRPESLKLVRPEIARVGRIETDPGWTQRRDVIYKDTSWHYECLEDLKERQRAEKTSLGFVPVGAIDKVWLDARPDEDRRKHEEKYAALLQLAQQQDLFAEVAALKRLEFQPYRVRVAWRCKRLDGPKACPGHTAGVLDWGLGELGRRKGWDKALQKMEQVANLDEHDLAFFCGNFKAHPGNFGIVGLWYPKRRDTARWEAQQAQVSLF